MSTLDARDNLNHIAHHWPDLQHQLGGLRSTPTDKITVTSSSDPQPPINLHIVDLLHEVEQWAAWGVVQLEQHAGVPQPTAAGTPASLRHLATHHEAWDGIDDFEHAATRFRRKVDKAIRNTPAKRYLGPCPTRGPDGAGCTGNIYINEGSNTHAICPVCDAFSPIGAQQEYIANELDNVLLTPVELHHALRNIGHDIPRGTIRSWISRGKLKPQEEDLYRLSDALNLTNGTA